MAKKRRTPQEASIDSAAQEMLFRADELNIGTAFSRADEMVPCNIGSAGMCCKICGMGPCRLTKEGSTGICGATIDTIQARNLTRAIASGAAAHSDHGRSVAEVFLSVARKESADYRIKDTHKLLAIAPYFDVATTVEIDGAASSPSRILVFDDPTGPVHDVPATEFPVSLPARSIVVVELQQA